MIGFQSIMPYTIPYARSLKIDDAMMDMSVSEVSDGDFSEELPVEVTHEDVQRVASGVEPKMTLIMKELVATLNA